MGELPRQNDRGGDQIPLRHLGGDAALVEDAYGTDDGKVPHGEVEAELIDRQAINLDGRVEDDPTQETEEHGRRKDHVPDETLHAPVLVEEDYAEGHETDGAADYESIEEAEGGVLGCRLIFTADGEYGVGLGELLFAGG